MPLTQHRQPRTRPIGSEADTTEGPAEFSGCQRRSSVLKPGHRIGSYEIRDVLGDGGMAMVYRATHTAMGTEHAIKLQLPNLAMNPKIVARFRQEARAQFRLRHPNIVQVTDYVETSEEIALVIDLVQGMMLWHLLAGRLPVNSDNNLELYELYAGTVPVPPLVDVVPGVPQALSEAVAQALSVDVSGRFQDALPLLRAVESGVAAHPVQQAMVVAVRPLEAVLAPVRPPAVVAVDDSKASAVATTAPLTEGASVSAGVMVFMVIFAIVAIGVAVANWNSGPDAATGAKTVTPAAAAATPQVAENPAKPAPREIDYAPKTRWNWLAIAKPG